jgi:hypothetical protein
MSLYRMQEGVLQMKRGASFSGGPLFALEAAYVDETGLYFAYWQALRGKSGARAQETEVC